MFTIRVEGQGEGYTMHECRLYSVKDEGPRRILVLRMGDQPEGARPPQLIEIAAGQVAYVMNSLGNTVDTIRSKRS